MKVPRGQVGGLQLDRYESLSQGSQWDIETLSSVGVTASVSCSNLYVL